MNDLYALMREKAMKLRREEFIAWVGGPVLIVDIVGDSAQPLMTGTPLAIESTVLLQDDGVARGHLGDGGAGPTRSAWRLDEVARRSGGTIEVGRDDLSDIAIEHHSISKVHAYLDKVSDGSYQIRDAGSRNGVTLNGRRVSDEGTRIRPEDVLRIGGVLARLAYPRALYDQLRETPKETPLRERLRDRTYARYFAAQLLDFLADTLYRTVLLWWVIAKVGGGQALSAIALVTLGSVLVTILGGGIAVDRFPRSRVLMFSLALRGLIVAAITIATMRDVLEVWHIYIAAIGFGIGDALFTPACAAILPDIVRREDLPGANALSTMGLQLASIVGPLCAAPLNAIGGHTFGFAFASILFLAAAIFAARLPHAAPHVPSNELTSSAVSRMSGFKDVVKLMLSEPWLWVTSLTVGTVLAVGFSLSFIALPPLVSHSLHMDIKYFAVIQGLYPLGSFLGGIIVARVGIRESRGVRAYLMAVITGLGCVAMSLPLGAIGVALGWLARGLAQAVLNLIWVGTLQELLPREMLGRAVSLDAVVGMSCLLVTLIGFGTLSRVAQPEVLFLVGGAVAMAVPLIGFILQPRIRTFD